MGEAQLPIPPTTSNDAGLDSFDSESGVKTSRNGATATGILSKLRSPIAVGRRTSPKRTDVEPRRRRGWARVTSGADNGVVTLKGDANSTNPSGAGIGIEPVPCKGFARGYTQSVCLRGDCRKSQTADREQASQKTVYNKASSFHDYGGTE
jgi:hypothetical protein